MKRISNEWKDYECIDTGNGEKLERWKDIYLLRPDPQIVWDNGDLLEKYRSMIDAVYYRSNKGGGHWENLKNIPGSWNVDYKGLTFNIKQMGFKHTGLFPEQAVNWDWMISKIKSEKSGVERYLSPISGSKTTIVLPVFSGRFATSIAADSAAPDEIPTSTPSSLPISFAVFIASSPDTFITSS